MCQILKRKRRPRTENDAVNAVVEILKGMDTNMPDFWDKKAKYDKNGVPLHQNYSVVNHRGKQDTHFEKDRELEFLNKFIKESRQTCNRPTRQGCTDLAQFTLSTARFAKEVSYKENILHPEKAAGEDILLMSKRLWHSSIVLKPGRKSDYTAPDLLATGICHLETSLQQFNEDLSGMAIMNRGLAADDLDLDSEDELDEKDPIYRARLDETSASETCAPDTSGYKGSDFSDLTDIE
ncbi:hypothetical protein LTR72_012080 [Exophiala xenobiotica]|nr:hypothetical protein LTR72_012080 [Exophiala xenobiotica]KAK5357228.1 hypothetical protein LTR11_011533 [Exophiala xenobiotica]